MLIAVLAGGVVIAIGIAVFIANKSIKPIASVSNPKLDSLKEQSEEAKQSTSLPPGWTIVGGVARPATDVQLNRNQPAENNIPDKVLHGFSPPVSPTANKQVEYVYAALKDHSNPNAYSSFAEAKPFNADAYKADPDKYINSVEPSRVFSAAQPGDGIGVIRPVGKPYHGVVQGEAVTLAVEATPGAPVTMTSFQLGYFENQLTSITVKADDKGVARAIYTAGGGTIDDVQIMAASPMTTGQVKFTVNVKLPN